LENAVENLLAFLDTMEPDPDLEDEEGEPDNDAEPSMGWTEQEARWGRYMEVQGDDLEPSLGSINPRLAAPYRGYSDAVGVRTTETSQDNWSKGNRDECEGDEHDGREPDPDGEPSLGSLNSFNQVHWGSSGTDDAEDECEDEGAEHDGREPEDFT
jgi:hypothetical protein